MLKTIQVKVIPNAKRNEIKEKDNRLKVYLTAPPVDGKANNLLIKVLAEHFNISKSHIRIVKGERARAKLIQVESP